jgi:transcription termination/antitermination protein NusG
MTDEPANDPAATPPTDEPTAEPTPHAPEAAPASAAEAVAESAAPVPAPVAEAVTEPVAPEAEAGVEEETAPDPEGAPEPEPAAPPELAEVAAITETSEAPTEATPAPSEALEEPAPASEPAAEAAPPSESSAEEPKPEELAPKPKRTRTPKAPKAAPAAAAAVVATETELTAAGEADEAATPAENKKKWYAIKVQSGREDTIKAAILRKVAIEGLEEFFGRIEIPVEEEIVKKSVRVKDKKTGEYTTQEKKVTKKKKKFHGYIFAELEFNDRILYLIRETSGVGDFLNMRNKPGQQPTPEPMPDHEVQAMLTGVAVKDPLKAKKIKLDFEKGDKVRIREGSFANSEGEVKSISEMKDPNEAPKVTVVLTFWGRPLDVELDASQVEKV